MTEIALRIRDYQQRVNDQLQAALQLEATAFPRLHEAMAYSVNAGGKRIRPLLAYASAEAFGIPPAQVDGFACALELVHTYSLIHDDLPAMDDDDMRRGRPSCHVAFDEATAILAGDALLTLSFRVIAESGDAGGDPTARFSLVAELAKACGALGMAGGQAMDLQLAGEIREVEQLERVHRLKTGALLCCAIEAPLCLASEVQQRSRPLLREFAEKLGLAFQVYDDYLDVVASTETLGKPAGSDQVQNKATYPALVGTDRSLGIANELIAESRQLLTRIDADTSLLDHFAAMVVSRSY